MPKFVLIISLLLSYQAHAEQNNSQFIGEWEGMGSQDNGTHWSIRLNIRPNFYVIDYPSLICGGVLTLIKSDNKSLVFKETLTYGIDRCINHGEIVLSKIAEHKVSYHWFSRKGKMEAVADLTRQPPLP